MQKISLDTITKIEGHARLDVRVEKGEIKKVQVEVYEGARLFEGILKGRKYDDVHYLCSRICGVCSQAHLIGALKAIEEALGVEASEQTEFLRELLMIGQIIQSHSLHLYFLALPDYLGYDNAIDMASKYKEEVRRALKIKRLGNEICTVIGGREIHSITPVVGGFSKIPSNVEIDKLLKSLKETKEDAIETVRLFENLNYEKFERKTEYVALKRGKCYAMMHGSVHSTEGLDIDHKFYDKYFYEYTTKYSTSKFVMLKGKSYMVGALARLNLNREYLLDGAKMMLRNSKFKFPNYSPYVNNFAQAIEILHLIERAIEILENLKIKHEKPVDVKLREGRGISATEVARGLLFHDYKLDEKGKVLKANILPPTTQNLKNIEDDITQILPKILNRSEEEIKLELEKLIRSYDPCISCSTHFLELNLVRK
ncbi:MAG: Ni/Fe hydrogenase subunit alpha [Candidatus Altiarchaeota archaeon]